VCVIPPEPLAIVDVAGGGDHIVVEDAIVGIPKDAAHTRRMCQVQVHTESGKNLTLHAALIA